MLKIKLTYGKIIRVRVVRKPDPPAVGWDASNAAHSVGVVDTIFDNVPQKMLFIVDKLLDKPLLSRKVIVEEDPTFDHYSMGIGACLSATPAYLY